MFRYICLALCLAVPVWSYSAGAPSEICQNNLVPDHPGSPQTSKAPYSFSAADGTIKSGESLSITLSGDKFLGFAIQAQVDGKPIGSFKIVDKSISQTLTCANKDDTLTHKKIGNPIKSMEFQWIAPKDFKGKAKIVGTVAKDGHTYWVRKVIKEITVA